MLTPPGYRGPCGPLLASNTERVPVATDAVRNCSGPLPGGNYPQDSDVTDQNFAPALMPMVRGVIGTI